MTSADDADRLREAAADEGFDTDSFGDEVASTVGGGPRLAAELVWKRGKQTGCEALPTTSYPLSATKSDNPRDPPNIPPPPKACDVSPSLRKKGNNESPCGAKAGTATVSVTDAAVDDDAPDGDDTGNEMLKLLY